MEKLTHVYSSQVPVTELKQWIEGVIFNHILVKFQKNFITLMLRPQLFQPPILLCIIKLNSRTGVPTARPVGNWRPAKFFLKYFTFN